MLLALCLVTLSGVLQLAAAVATITLVLVTGIESVLGLGPAIFLTAGALAALPAGRLMDRYGRVPVLAGGFVVGAVGCLLTALGCVADSAPLVVLGFLGVGGMNGAVLLARTAVADMYPESRKARAISYVLFGALFGAALGPLVFRPLFAGKDLELDTLIVPWLAACGDVRRRAHPHARDTTGSAHDRVRARARGPRAWRRAYERSPPRRSARSCVDLESRPPQSPPLRVWRSWPA